MVILWGMISFAGRNIDASAEPTRDGLFVRCRSDEDIGLHIGDVVEVNGRKFRVKYVLKFPAGEPEVWAMLASQLAPPADLPF